MYLHGQGQEAAWHLIRTTAVLYGGARGKVKRVSGLSERSLCARDFLNILIRQRIDSSTTCVASAVIRSILQLGKMRPREVKKAAQVPTADW